MNSGKSIFASSLFLALAASLPIAAHAGFNGDTVTGTFNYGGSTVLNFGSQTIGAGTEFSGNWIDSFNQSWDISVDVFDNGATFAWTESTRASEPNGGNISSAPDTFSFDLVLSSATLPSSFPMVTFSSSGAYSPLTSSLTTLSLTTPQSVHVGFSRMDTTDVYTITAVPEPETYAMLLAGLGLVGAVARRRKTK